MCLSGNEGKKDGICDGNGSSGSDNIFGLYCLVFIGNSGKAKMKLVVGRWLFFSSPIEFNLETIVNAKINLL